jgi:hypothetical protein
LFGCFRKVWPKLVKYFSRSFMKYVTATPPEHLAIYYSIYSYPYHRAYEDGCVTGIQYVCLVENLLVSGCGTWCKIQRWRRCHQWGRELSASPVFARS